MAEKILQLLPCPNEVRVAWYKEGRADLHKPTCMGLIEKGANQEIVYFETVDNLVEKVDTEDKLFLGFVEVADFPSIEQLQKQAQERYKKEQSVKSKL
jgi:hypothetical protein